MEQYYYNKMEVWHGNGWTWRCTAVCVGPTHVGVGVGVNVHPRVALLHARAQMVPIGG